MKKQLALVVVFSISSALNGAAAAPKHDPERSKRTEAVVNAFRERIQKRREVSTYACAHAFADVLKIKEIDGGVDIGYVCSEVMNAMIESAQRSQQLADLHKSDPQHICALKLVERIEQGVAGMLGEGSEAEDSYSEAALSDNEETLRAMAALGLDSRIIASEQSEQWVLEEVELFNKVMQSKKD